MGDVEPKRPLSRLLFIGYLFSAMGLMLTLAGACTAWRGAEGAVVRPGAHF